MGHLQCFPPLQAVSGTWAQSWWCFSLLESLRYHWTYPTTFQRRACQEATLPMSFPWRSAAVQKRETQSHLLPQEKDGYRQQLSGSSRAARALAVPRGTSRCGKELGGRRVLVSWEPAEDEKFGYQDANPQDLIVCCLWETFWSCYHRIFLSSMEAEFLSGKSSKDTKKAWCWS